MPASFSRVPNHATAKTSFNISAWSIRQPVPTLVLFLILTVLGLFFFPQLEIDADPNLDIPGVTITVTQPGADPTELESQITRPIEDAVAGLGNIDNITSTIANGVSNTAVYFVLGTNSDRATNDVRNAVAQIRQSLPQNINDPIVKRIDTAGGSVLSYAVVSDRLSLEQLSDLIDQKISRDLLAVPGVAQVQRVGGVDREIRVDLNLDRLQALEITATQVNDQIRSLNINLPGGQANVGDSEQTIRTLGSASSVQKLENYPITLPKGDFVPLATLGKITNGYSQPRQAAYLNGKPVVAFSVIRSPGATIVTVEEGLRAAVSELEKTLPAGVKLKLIYTVADFIRESYQASIDALVLGAVLAVATILIFLRDWRATLITAVALPLSVIPTFAVLKALNYTLNSMTLLSLALVVGILVDDAIVEIENIERHIQMGKTPMRAALDASNEIGLAVIATTMSIVSVFVPVAFMGGIPGQFFRPFGVTVAVSVLFSLLVARTITPLMAAYLLKGKRRQHEQLHKDRLSYQYRRLLTWALKHRVQTLALAVAFFASSLLLVPYIPTGFIDRDDTGISTVSIELPPGSTLNQTDQVVQQATQLLKTNPAVDVVLASEGAAAVSRGTSFGGNSVNTASLYIKLKPRDKRIGQVQFEAQMTPQLNKIPGARIGFNQGSFGGKQQLTVILRSQNPEALTQTSAQLTQQMHQIPGLVDVTSSASLTQPEILIKPDLYRAADQGVTVDAIASTASIATIGDIDANLAKFDLPTGQIPIRVELAPQFREDIDTIRNLQVPAKNHTLVPLMSVAQIVLGSGPSEIHRYNRARQISLGANLQGLTLGQAYSAVKKLPALKHLPPSVEQEASGDAKLMAQVFGGFAAALGTAILFVYAVLTILFSNFLHPITIMAALPLSIGGALVALLMVQKSIGLYALIGILLLMGIVTKNSILLVDYALINQHEGKPMYRAVLESGVGRLRPILMTTIAMIAGMLPIALELGAGSQVRSPMAIAVIGGLMTSTLLTLVIIPVIFTYIGTFQNQIFRLMWLMDKKNALDTDTNFDIRRRRLK
ncbi:MAG: efflux RND transporter permease subunit [Chroococcidiopsidaceae cyanobacterium CP_BM_ER_R8_30]|nr:efflux RND transporter permease subunit [Chroococcidiopsidaceae cyanobacterium CP_BM_ER_R8_30]